LLCKKSVNCTHDLLQMEDGDYIDDKAEWAKHAISENEEREH
jgi:hypothetical protein